MKQQNVHLKDLLLVYIRNHFVPVYFYAATAVIFLGLKIWMYSIPTDIFLIWAYNLAICLSALMVFRQRKLYIEASHILSDEACTNSMAQTIIFKIMINKLGYLLPWLFILFSPLNSTQLFYYLLGFAFVVCASPIYASASAAVPQLLLFDIGVPMSFALAVTIKNRHIQETPYLGWAIAFFCLYLLYVGAKIRESQIEILQSRLAMEQSARVAKDANAAKSRFLALMSHEIRTPMTGILGMVEFMKETRMTAEQQGFINTISDCSKTLLNTLNDILDISKLEAGKLQISNVNFDLRTVIGNSARVMQLLAEEKDIYLKVDIADSVPALVYGDPHRMQQCIINFLNNAVKFTATGGVTLHASFRDALIPMLRIDVTDTGIGISKENLKKLFRSFSQADSSTSRKYGGTGLGLSIIKSLVALMGGKIGVKSEEGKGSTFWFEVPYHEPIAAVAGEEEKPVPEIAPLLVLLAEDNKVNQQIALRLLGGKGHKVDVAENGQVALHMVQEKPYDMVLMDVNMPVMSGLEATQKIRELGGRYAGLPVIALTASVMEEYIQQCYDAGMNDYVAKPFAPRALYAAMARHAPDSAKLKEGEQMPAAATAATPEEPRKKMTLNANLRAIREELGAEYMTTLVDNSAKEVRHLLSLITEAVKQGDYPALHRSAHDLKSVSGLVGMTHACHAAEKLEIACTKGERAAMPQLISELETEAMKELAEIEEVKGD